MSLTDDDVREILRIIDESELDELRLETGGLSLYVRRGGGGVSSDPTPVLRADAPSLSAPAASGPQTSADNGLLTVTAPMLGTFYRAEGPGRPPFVEVGSTVEPDTIVCIIEVMKMMNSVPAGVAGTVVEVCHENAVLTEYGAPLFRVRPA